MKRRALVSQPRFPEPDRDRGSQRVEELISFLLAAGWSVTFLAQEDPGDARYARRLRQRGVATYAGYRQVVDLVSDGIFDLALLAFWEPAAQLIPEIRRHSPRTRIVVDSIDIHFLREARRRLGVDGHLDGTYGSRMAGELNAYQSADAVLAVSQREQELLGDFLGPGRVHCLQLSEPHTRSEVPFDDRSGMLFVGNFRHLPNREAVEFLCKDVVPRLDPALLAQHPLTVVGNRLDDTIAGHADGVPGVRMLGWVPSVTPYLEQARVCLAPLLHGAGVKGKVLRAMMIGTPVVTNRIGAEGLDVVHDKHVLLGERPAELAAAVTRLLVDRETWQRIAGAASDHVRASNDHEAAGRHFLEIVERVLAETDSPAPKLFRHEQARISAYQRTVAAVRDAIDAVTPTGSTVLVVSRGDDELLEVDGRRGRHFPGAPDGSWAGYHPSDSTSAIAHLEACRAAGAEFLVVPSTSFWWFHHYRELNDHLAGYCRVFGDDHAAVFDLREPVDVRRPEGHLVPTESVLVLGRLREDCAGAHPALVAELQRSQRYAVEQRWRREDGNLDVEATLAGVPPEVDWVVFVEADAVLPGGFLDDFLDLATTIGADRAQASHVSGPSAGAPVTSQVRGCVAREVTAATSLPVLAVRTTSAADAPVWLVDALPVRLRSPLPPVPHDADAHVVDVVVAAPDGSARRGVRRHVGGATPSISVLLATYDRPDLLEAALEGFCGQTVDAAAFEVVVVDDGSPGEATTEVLTRYEQRLPLVHVRIDHAGRSAAKNLATMLARGEIVLFFDDDDRPAPDLLDEHLRMHETHPDEGYAVLGYTDWAEELEVTPLMHYLTDVDKLLFAYGNLEDGQVLDWRGFWEGRISCKRRFLMRHGLHDERLAYSIDVEMAWRLAPHGLKVIYHAAAVSHMARPISFDDFCRRIEAKGRAQAAIASLHNDPEIQRYTKAECAAAAWDAARATLDADVAQVRRLEAALEVGDHDEATLAQLHLAYRAVFLAHNVKGIVEASAVSDADGPPAEEPAAPVAGRPTLPPVIGFDGAGLLHRHPDEPSRPALTVVIPVWSRSEGLADMAVRTVQRIHEVATMPTEVIVVDNGSPHLRTFDATVLEFPENRGVASAWNAGIGLARAPLVAVLNSDCTVEPGWDAALCEAAVDGRRVAFPYTDHADGEGFRQPDQGGTAGWCFVLTKDLYEEIGPFDERFNPAYGEDTDYWHRAWDLGIELTPVPAARVTHARRTTARVDPHVDWLLQSHRYLYGWKHGVDPLRAPPYYNRPIVEYHGLRRVPA